MAGFEGLIHATLLLSVIANIEFCSVTSRTPPVGNRSCEVIVKRENSTVVIDLTGASNSEEPLQNKAVPRKERPLREEREDSIESSLDDESAGSISRLRKRGTKATDSHMASDSTDEESTGPATRSRKRRTKATDSHMAADVTDADDDEKEYVDDETLSEGEADPKENHQPDTCAPKAKGKKK